MFTHRKDLLGIFANHPVAANLMMAMMVLAGLVALTRLNTQFFPDFAIDFVTVQVAWSGASAEDVESLITTPIEQELRNVDSAKEMTSVSADGFSNVILEFTEGTDMGLAVDQVKEKVDLVRNLPATAETPEINRIVRYEPIARLLLSGPGTIDEIRSLARRFERELLDRGIARIDIDGLPEEEIAIQVSSTTLRELGMSVDQIGQRVSAVSRDVPVGTIGRDQSARQLRFVDQRRGELAFESLPLIADESGRLITLADISTIRRRPQDSQISVLHNGKPAVELRVQRSESADSLESARIFEDWLEETRATLPPGVSLHAYDQQWQLIKQRIGLLIKNGGGGLLLVIMILFLFLNARVAFWVTMGIPASFFAALAALYLAGGSVNMISLFGLIMALGIIVDDAIVVGEDAMSHYQSGESPLEAAEDGARRMLAPVMSSSITTISAFLPLMLVGGIIGTILRSIPIVVICVIVASLVESFLVLPGHLRGAFAKMGEYRPGRLRARLDSGFMTFRDRLFRPLVTAVLSFRGITLTLTMTTLLLSIGWLTSGRIQFQFFPSAESTTIYANIDFVSGTPANRVQQYLNHMGEKLRETEAALGGNLVDTAVARLGATVSQEQSGSRRGDHYGSLLVELTEPDTRDIRNRDFIGEWRSRLTHVSGLDNLTITERRGGPPGRDLEIRITGSGIENVKAAALALAETLNRIDGVSGVEDDMPYGREQIVLELTPEGQSLGLSVQDVSRQLRAAYDGHLVQILADDEEEVEVRVVLRDGERNRYTSLDDVDIVLADGATAPLSNIVTHSSRRGFDSIRHAEGKLAVTVSGDVDAAVANSNRIVANLEQDALPLLSSRYGVDFTFRGRQEDQRETISDMRTGALIAVVLIYLVLAWVFGSYGWPLVVMAIIPFGLVGAIWGHVLMGLDLTILSMFGFFGLSGIVVNDSIILVVFFRNLRRQGMAVREALIEAACQRLRAVLLTSLTTIAGLTPLLFETSLQAQFLIPMAVSIAFGLAFATLLVLLVIPCLLDIHEQVRGWFIKEKPDAVDDENTAMAVTPNQ